MSNKNNTTPATPETPIFKVPAISPAFADKLVKHLDGKYRMVSALSLDGILPVLSTIGPADFRRAALYALADDAANAATDKLEAAKAKRHRADELRDEVRRDKNALAARGVTARKEDVKAWDAKLAAAEKLMMAAADAEEAALNLITIPEAAGEDNRKAARDVVKAMTVQERRLFDLFRAVTCGAPACYDVSLLEAYVKAARAFRATAEGTKERAAARKERREKLGDLLAYFLRDAAKLNAGEVDFITDNLLPSVNIAAARVNKKGEADKFTWIMRETSVRSIERTIARVVWAKGEKIKFIPGNVKLIKF